MNRKKLISDLVDRILDVKGTHPIKVGVSGITASGKTTLANEIAEEILVRKKNAIRASIDYFHNPRAIRYKQGKDSAIGYYEDAHDYEAFREKLLLPLCPGGNLYYHTVSLDLATDKYVRTEPKRATKDMVFIIDGTFLFKKDLIKLYDFKIFVKTDFEIARNRGALREQHNFGGYDKAESIFINRYHAASKLYIDQHLPERIADIVINNNDFDDPYFEC
ncbi:hypothetical protein [Peribacillus alkalitolerans]|uniref:hypothetical protein n=1 Tax=Peribacillus alkalitolerans TaxID=1550385 RepID=UPI0013D11A53|nr:hypothetical protein [Peribacillus alkalitolerans]